jgi:addiction module HigA family antidote
MAKKLTPISPGEVLAEEFMKPMQLSQNRLARAIDVPVGRINEIIRGKRGLSRDTAARLAVYFGTSPGLWLNLQAQYDAKIAQRELMPRYQRTIPKAPAAA